MSSSDRRARAVIHLGPGEGRRYPLGAMTSVFKADGDETDERYSISEWWLEPHSDGPGAHEHEAHDDVFYVIEGTITFYVDGAPIEATPGTFVRVPARVRHDFANRGERRAGLLNFYLPGGFERQMPAIVDWFRRHPNGSDTA